MTGAVIRVLIERCLSIRGSAPREIVLPSDEAWMLATEALLVDRFYDADRASRFVEALFHPPKGESATCMGVPVRADDSRRRILIRL